VSRIDAQTPERADLLGLLRGVPFFAPLEPAGLERLASSAHRVSVPDGTVVIKAGDHGDRFYVVRSGSLSVTAGERRSADLGPGDGFGEIALLHDVPRTATVTALGDVELVAIDREPFLEVVTGFDESGREAELVIAARLSRLRAITVSG
jgi:CRP-like cAMP-binding protein